MKRKGWFGRAGVILGGALSLGGAWHAPAGAAQPAGLATPANAPYLGYARGRLLTMPRAGLATGAMERVFRGLGMKARPLYPGRGVHVVELPAGMDEVAALDKLRRSGKFKFVELDMAVAPSATVSDPGFGNSWGATKIGAPTAWDDSTGAGIVVAVLDTGVYAGHPDLAGQVIAGWNAYDNNTDTADVYGHGTKVAGVVAMAANNGIGSAGVAHDASIMPIRISDLNGTGYYSTTANGLYWAADHGARVANISYNGMAGSAAVVAAADYLRGKGGVVVLSSGNTGAASTTAASDKLLVVGATDSNDVVASFSTYGPNVDLSAPGVGIYTTTYGGGYANASGTSFACPMTAATVALMFGANPALAAADVETILFDTARDLGAPGRDDYYGYGRIDAAVAAALTATAQDNSAPAVSVVDPLEGQTVSGTVPVDVQATDNVAVTRVELLVDGQLLATDEQAPFGFAWDATAFADGRHTLQAQAYDAAGNVGQSAPVTAYLGADQTAPNIYSLTPGDGAKLKTPKDTLSARASDDRMVAVMRLYFDGKLVASSTSGSVGYTLMTNKLAGGAHVVTVQAEDGAGNLAERSVTVYR